MRKLYTPLTNKGSKFFATSRRGAELSMHQTLFLQLKLLLSMNLLIYAKKQE